MTKNPTCNQCEHSRVIWHYVYCVLKGWEITIPQDTCVNYKEKEVKVKKSCLNSYRKDSVHAAWTQLQTQEKTNEQG